MKSLLHRFILLLIQEAEEKQVRELLNHVHWLSRSSTRCASEAGGVAGRGNLLALFRCGVFLARAIGGRDSSISRLSHLVGLVIPIGQLLHAGFHTGMEPTPWSLSVRSTASFPQRFIKRV